MAETLAALHAVDPDAVGLGDLGRHEGYIERQLKRWRGHTSRCRSRVSSTVAWSSGSATNWPGGCRCSSAPGWSTGTTAWTTWCWTNRARCGPSWTGRSAPWVTRWPTSGCSWSIGPTPPTRWPSWVCRPPRPRASRPASEVMERYAARISRSRRIGHRLLHRLRLLEAGLHPSGRLRPLRGRCRGGGPGQRGRLPHSGGPAGRDGI